MKVPGAGRSKRLSFIVGTASKEGELRKLPSPTWGQPKTLDIWDPPDGEFYLTSQYYEPEDGSLMFSYGTENESEIDRNQLTQVFEEFGKLPEVTLLIEGTASEAQQLDAIRLLLQDLLPRPQRR